MSEKKKWFDSRKIPVQLPEPILSVSCVTEEEVRELGDALAALRGSPRASTQILGYLAALPPANRLAVNLGAFFNLLAARNVRSVIPDGLTQRELQALIALQSHAIPAKLRETAQGLLNVYERYSMLAAVGRMFREERARPWEVGIVRTTTAASRNT